MIVYKKDGIIRLYQQHEHARIAGEMARAWKEEWFEGYQRWNDVIYSATEHDRGWIDFDETLMWDVNNDVPHSFITLPIPIKKHIYRIGLDEIESVNPYAALLSSLQFCKLMGLVSNDRHAEDFIKQEQFRHERIKYLQDIKSTVKLKELYFHLSVLRFCDDLSLFLCMYPPGTSNTATWFSQGLTEKFDFLGGKPVIPNWDGEEVVRLSSFPFETDLNFDLIYREIYVADIPLIGLQAAYKKAKCRRLNNTLTQDLKPTH